MAINNVQESTNPRKRDEYNKDRFDWLDQVATDPELPASAFKVAYVIATSLWRNKGTVTLVTPQNGADDDVREAWIGTRDIADKIAMSRFTVMNMVDRLKDRRHLEFDPGKQGRGHSNHYRLVAKGAPANLLEGKKAKPKGAPANLLDSVKGAHSSLLEGAQAELKGAPTHLNPLSKKEGKRGGAQQARPDTGPSAGSIGGPESLNRTQGAIVVDDGDDGVALRAPPDHLDRGFENKSEQERWQGKVIDQDGVEFKPPPPYERRPIQKTWMEASMAGLNRGRS
jgi:hypothetical protein